MVVCSHTRNPKAHIRQRLELPCVIKTPCTGVLISILVPIYFNCPLKAKWVNPSAYVIVVSWAPVVCLICIPSALGLLVYVSGKPQVHMIQLICTHVPSPGECKTAPARNHALLKRHCIYREPCWNRLWVLIAFYPNCGL